MWELIEPLDDDGIYARFPAEKGEGVHHVAVATPVLDVKPHMSGFGPRGAVREPAWATELMDGYW